MPKRVAPKWSTDGPVARPDRVAGFVMPLIVRSPSISIVSPSRLMFFETKVSSGWRSASKKSGASRWAWRFFSLTWMLSILATPFSWPSSRVASNSGTSPENVATAYGTSKPTRE